ncbi:MAG: hypothetical protein ACFFBQ_04280 [Promethearchaeota archaeon]
MPWPFKKKKEKKKKILPEPPSFSNEVDSSISTPPMESVPPSIRGPPVESSRELSPPSMGGVPVYEGPPRDPSPPPITGPPVYEGPPREPSPHPSELPTPPPFIRTDPSDKPIKSQQPVQAQTPIFNDDLAEEIHAELRKRDFGSGMKKAPERQAVSVSTEDLAKRHLRDAKQEYIAAAEKHLELNFFDNAATNFACAVLCDLMAEGWQVARESMTKLTSVVPSAVIENSFFDSVRFLLEAIRTKNYTFFTRAERSLQQSMQHLYPEDAAMVQKAIKIAQEYFGY